MIDGHKPENRKKQLINCIPDVYDYNTLMYVGGHTKFGRNLQLCDEFLDHNYIIDVLEAHLPNCRDMEREFKWINDIYNGDIRDDELCKKYDIIMFWHGIEHIEKSEMPALIKNLEKYANKLIIFACPWGVHKQGELYDNPYELHTSHWYPDELEALGLQVNAIGQKDTPLKSNIIAWKRTE